MMKWNLGRIDDWLVKVLMKLSLADYHILMNTCPLMSLSASA